MEEQITVEERWKRVNAAIATLASARSEAMRKLGDSLLRVDPERLPEACTEIDAALRRAQLTVITNPNVRTKSKGSRKRRAVQAIPRLVNREAFRVMLREIASDLEPGDFGKLMVELPHLAERARVKALPGGRKDPAGVLKGTFSL